MICHFVLHSTACVNLLSHLPNVQNESPHLVCLFFQISSLFQGTNQTFIELSMTHTPLVEMFPCP